jgi:hypothetical protein
MEMKSELKLKTQCAFCEAGTEFLYTVLFERLQDLTLNTVSLLHILPLSHT